MMRRKRSAIVANSRRLCAPLRAEPAAPIRCPRCASANTSVRHTAAKPVRYHACADCGQRFKSIEKPIRGEPLLKGE